MLVSNRKKSVLPSSDATGGRRPLGVVGSGQRVDIRAVPSWSEHGAHRVCRMGDGHTLREERGGKPDMQCHDGVHRFVVIRRPDRVEAGRPRLGKTVGAAAGQRLHVGAIAILAGSRAARSPGAAMPPGASSWYASCHTASTVSPGAV